MSDTTAHGDHGHGGHGGMGHPVPWPILVGVWIGLMILTVITVAVTYVDLGALNIIIAMGVATMKASLVVAFFMHLFWDKPLNSITFLFSILFVAVFLAFTIIDTKQYKASIDKRNLDFVPTETTGGGGGGTGAAWVPPALEDEDKALVERIKGIVDGGAGDAAAGKAAFTQRCATCHKLGGEGAEVGPELDSFDRANKERLLISIAVPSAEIRQGYDNYMFKTSEGPKIGVIVKEDNDTVTIKDSVGKEWVIKKSDIKGERKKLPVSLMPTGLFDGLSEDEVRNLIAYIQSFPAVAPAPAK